MSRYGYISFVLTVSMIFAAACHRRPLEDPDDFVRIRIAVNTDSIQNVTSSIYNKSISVPEIRPEMMRVIFYNEAGNRIAADTYISQVAEENGRRILYGDMSILPGKYNILAYNFDTESILIKNDDKYSSTEAYTGAVTKNLGKAFSMKAPEPVKVFEEPEHLVVAKKEQYDIPYHEGVHVIEAEAKTLVETYYVQIKVVGLQYVSSAQAILSGLVKSKKIATGERVNEPITEYFALQKSKDNGDDVICAVFNTFGRIEDSVNELWVTFSLETGRGKPVQKSFEISNLFNTEDGKLRHWLLLEQTITVEKPEKPGTGGGFLPEVGDWENEHHEIEL